MQYRYTFWKVYDFTDITCSILRSLCQIIKKRTPAILLISCDTQGGTVSRPCRVKETQLKFIQPARQKYQHINKVGIKEIIITSIILVYGPKNVDGASILPGILIFIP